jgi:uncharacterized protein
MMVAVIDSETAPGYEAEILAWRKSMEDKLRAEDGWLTLTGLFWLNEGENTIGSDAACDVNLPESVAPAKLGILDLRESQVTLRVIGDAEVKVDGVKVSETVLRDEWSAEGASLVEIGSARFFIIQRGGQYGVRVRDLKNPARENFTGRKWFPINGDYRVNARYTPYETPRQLNFMTSANVISPIDNLGYVEFELHEQPFRLDVYTEEGQFWFIFKDATSGHSTYGAGRFLKASPAENGLVALDFNKAYSPPCAFTPYAACPLATKENTLPIKIEAGELYSS